MESTLRVLANSALPQPPGFILRHFGVYTGGIAAGAQEAAWQAQGERRSLKEILARIPATEKPDILLIRSPEYLPLPFDLATFRGLKVLLLTDWNVGLRFLAPLCGLFDIAFTDEVGAAVLRKAGVKNVFAAAMYGHDAHAMHDLHLPRDLDLSFCGNLNAGLHRERNRVLARLLPLRDRHRLHLTQSFGRAYHEVLSRSRLVFNHSIRGEANMRLYEAMACGAVPLVERGNIEVPLLFHEGEHFAAYDAANPLPDIEALLSEPDKIAVMGRAAKAAVTDHSAEKQLSRMLREALRRTGYQSGIVTREIGTPEQASDGLSALRKLRVLGSGFTLREAVDEMQAATVQDMPLRLETFPGLLLSLLERERGKPDRLPTLLSWIEQMVEHPNMPTLLAAAHRLHLAVSGGQVDSIHQAADALLEEIAKAPASVPEAWYRHLFAPIDLAKPFNTDINAAFRARIETGKDQGLLDLLLAQALAAKAQALKRRDHWTESAQVATGIPAGRFLSVTPFALRAEAALRLGDIAGLMSACTSWHEDNPLDGKVWDAVVSLLAEAGIHAQEYLRRYLGLICSLAKAFLREGIPPALQSLAERHGILPLREGEVKTR